MKSTHKAGLVLLLLLSLTIVLVINANMQMKAQNRELNKAVFKVA